MELKPASFNRYEIVIFVASLILVASMFIILGSQLNIKDSRLAFDWKIIWHAIEDGHIHWGEGMYNPPWTVLFLLPMGFLPLEVGWSLMMFILLAVLIVSIPPTTPRWRHWVSVVLLVTAYPVMRDYADSNLEAIAIGSVLLLLTAYQHRWPILFTLAALLATIKPQATYLLLMMAMLYFYQTAPRPHFWEVCAVILAVVIPTFIWQGRPWLQSLLDSSLDYGISIKAVWADFPQGVILMLQIVVVGAALLVAYGGDRQISHPKAAMLVAAGLLASPYSNKHSVIMVLVLGVMPLMLSRPRLGIPLFVLYDMPYLGLISFPVKFGSSFWHVVLILTWVILLAYVYRTERVSRLKAHPSTISA